MAAGMAPMPRLDAVPVPDKIRDPGAYSGGTCVNDRGGKFVERAAGGQHAVDARFVDQRAAGRSGERFVAFREHTLRARQCAGDEVDVGAEPQAPVPPPARPE